MNQETSRRLMTICQDQGELTQDERVEHVVTAYDSLRATRDGLRAALTAISHTLNLPGSPDLAVDVPLAVESMLLEHATTLEGLSQQLRDMTDRYHEASGEADRLRDQIAHGPAYRAAMRGELTKGWDEPGPGTHTVGDAVGLKREEDM